MISKSKIKQIHALELKKNRDEQQLFVAEGPKIVEELQERFSCTYLAATQEWAKAHPKAMVSDTVTQEELKRASFLKTPQQVLAVFRREKEETPHPELLPDKELCLGLDGIQNPGNLGTIIRLADWFGIRHLFCSTDTADAFAPKTVQSTMGALARVHIHYCALEELLASCKDDVPVYGTFLDGKNMYEQTLEQRGLIIMGNEGKGIRPSLEPYIKQRLFIPCHASGPTSESLNVAIATAIVCAEFRRRG